jgi:hypothetical protein
MPYCFVLQLVSKDWAFIITCVWKLKRPNMLIWLSVFGKLKGKLPFDAKATMF